MVSGEEVKHPLPPSIRKGEFYMHNGKPIVPVDKDMAVWFKFELLTNGLPKVPYALKILVGGINVITGETEHGEQEVLTLENNQPNTQVGQNYLILPSQRWIDGFKTGNGTVRQFIVQEFGLNATVEEKLKGTQDGVIQFIAFPPTQAVIQQAKEEETIKLLTHIQNKKASFGPTYLFTGANITGATKGGGGGGVSKVGLAAGAQIVQDINVSTFPIDTFDPTRAQVFDLTLLDAHTFHELEGLPKPPRMPTQDEYDEICGWYYHLPVPASQRVEADPHSRLVAADQQGELTALPPVEMALPPVETALKFSIFGSSQENPPEEPTKPQDAPPSKGF